MKAMTVKELKEALEQFDENMQVVILREGKGHHSAINTESMSVVNGGGCYFPDDTPDITSEKALQIGWI